MVTRIYPYTDALMLAGGKVVAANLRCCIKELSDIRSEWKRDYITNLDSCLDSAFSELLGFSIPEVHRFLKLNIYQSLQQAAFDLSCLKIQIEVDYQDHVGKKDECLTLLGFTKYSQKLTDLPEESLISLLKHFDKNLSPCIRYELVKNGVSTLLLDNLAQESKLLEEMGAVQSSLLVKNRELNGSQVAILNSLYSEVAGICAIASTFFERKPKKLELFTFPAVVNRLKGICGEELNLI